MLLNKLLSIILLFTLCSCNSAHKAAKAEPTVNTTTSNEKGVSEKVDYSGKPTTVYKTTNDYKKNVPVVLSEDKKKIISYPAPSDIFYKGNLAYPTELTNGYLLDNRGISANTAFTKYTYEEYSKLQTAPDLITLYNAIIDKDPIKEMYNCGNRYRFIDEVAELNSTIKNNQLGNFKKIK